MPPASRPTSQYGPWAATSTPASGPLQHRHSAHEGRPLSQTQAATIHEIPGHSPPSIMHRSSSAQAPRSSADMRVVTTMDSSMSRHAPSSDNMLTVSQVHGLTRACTTLTLPTLTQK
jgi:hypothetical protein